MSNASERFGDALQSIIETAEAAGASKQDLIDSLESAIENLMTEDPPEDDAA